MKKNAIKKTSLIAGIILTSTLVVSLSACHERAPSELKYNNFVYVTNFYTYGDKAKENYFVAGLSKPEEDPIYKKGEWDFWQTNKFGFDCLYGVNREAISWSPTLYCKKDEAGELKDFYRFKGTYDYYFGIRYSEENDKNKILLSDDSYNNVFDSFIDIIMGESKPSTITISDQNFSEQLTCGKESKDGLFATYKEELLSYENAIYITKYHGGSKNTITLYDLKEDGKKLYSLFLEKELI